MNFSTILMVSAILIVISSILFACKEKKPAHHHSNHAQAHMHSKPVSELIERFDDPARDEWQKPQQVIRFMNLSPGAVVADLGAGSGYFSLRLAREGYRVLALDIDQAFIAHIDRVKAKQLAGTSEAASLETRLIEPGTTGLSNSSVDAILTVNTYHHFNDRVDFLKKLNLALKPGGTLYIVDFKDGELPVGPKPEHKIQESQMIEEMTKAGFLVSEERDLLPYQTILSAKKF